MYQQLKEKKFFIAYFVILRGYLHTFIHFLKLEVPKLK